MIEESNILISNGLERQKVEDVIISPIGVFSPQPDMTPIEACWVSALFAFVSVVPYMDTECFAQKHNIKRHFKLLGDATGNE